MTQNSREVLIELLFLALYLDNHVSVAEDEIINDAMRSLGWESEQPRENFIFKAFSGVRDAVTTLEKTQAFIIARTDILKQEGAETDAYMWLSKVLGSDGLTDTEKYFLSRLETRLFH